MRRSKSQENNLDVITFETFKPKSEKNSASWSTATELKTKFTTSFDDEQEQIYDTVQPSKFIQETEERKSLESSNQDYCTLQKMALNSSSFYTSLTSKANNSMYDVPRKATSVYNIVDARKKEEQHQKRPWYKLKVTSVEDLSCSLPLEGHYDFPKRNMNKNPSTLI